ncbi:MAG: endo-alpha-N-acetylgalactosaminidase family protein, partial [Ginsengibacter sp.]
MTIEITDPDNEQVINEQTHDVELKSNEMTFTFNFKCNVSLLRVKATYTFVEPISGKKVVYAQTLPILLGKQENSESGEYYDYTKTYAPERLYMHNYGKTLTIKMFLAHPDRKGGSKVLINCEQALQNIQEVDAITRGIPKIVYLVGWQYNGHDDKYPAWDEVNAALRRPEDATALDSFLWLKREARKYNTTISVHINMTDSYTNSPLWETYTNNNLIARNADGSFLQIGRYNGISSYEVCYTREWDSGFAQKRIDDIVNMLQLRSAGPVHIDAFFPRASEYFGITREMETRAMRKIYRYWRDEGIDVTSEEQARMRPDPFIGLQPMAWWFDLSRKQQTTIHQNLACGGMPYQPNDSTNGFLFGQSMHGEDL